MLCKAKPPILFSFISNFLSGKVTGLFREKRKCKIEKRTEQKEKAADATFLTFLICYF